MSMSTHAKVVIGVCVAALVGGVVVATRETDPVAPGSADPPPVLRSYPGDPGSSTPVTPAPVPVAGGCRDEDDYPNELTMYFGSGEINADLVLCTDEGQTRALVENTSDSTVYFLADGSRYGYWELSDDLDQEADVRLFRAAIRLAYGAQRSRPFLTIEPGERVRFTEPPGGLRFGTDVQQQAAWRTAVLQAMVYEQAKEQATERLEDYFEKKTPTGLAAVTCTVNAYEVGKTIGGTVDDPSSLLFEDVYDSGKGAYDCTTALAAAERASRAEGRVPLLSKQALLQASRQPTWKQATNAGFRTVLEIGSEAIKVR